MKVDRENYFKTLDFVNEINAKNFWELDLSEFFENLPEDKKRMLREKYSNINNYNIIYLLSSQEYLRKEYDIKLSKSE